MNFINDCPNHESTVIMFSNWSLPKNEQSCYSTLLIIRSSIYFFGMDSDMTLGYKIKNIDVEGDKAHRIYKKWIALAEDAVSDLIHNKGYSGDLKEIIDKASGLVGDYEITLISLEQRLSEFQKKIREKLDDREYMINMDRYLVKELDRVEKQLKRDQEKFY